MKDLVMISDSGDPNESPVYRNGRYNKGKMIFTMWCFPECDTIPSLFRAAAHRFSEQPCLGERLLLSDGSFGSKYLFKSYSEILDLALNFAKGLRAIGVEPYSKIALILPNCVWWMIACIGAHFNSCVIIPLDENVGPENCHEMLCFCECRIVIAKYRCIRLLKSDQISNFILVGGADLSDFSGDPKLVPIETIISKGSQHDVSLTEPTPDDLAFIIFISGHSSDAKGCMLNHRNMITGATGAEHIGVSLSVTDVYYSFLPLRHVYEISVELMFMGQGSRIGYVSDHPRSLFDDLSKLQPTIICCVPKIIEGICAKIRTLFLEMSSIERFLVSLAIQWNSCSEYSSMFLGCFVFRKFRELLGGRIRAIGSAAAPVRSDEFEQIRRTVTRNIFQGYGMAETAGALAIDESASRLVCSQGKLGAACEFKLIKAQGYAYDPRADMCGEILVRGPQVFLGYYKNEAATREVLTDDWFHTGDVVRLGEDGSVHVLDRLNEVITLSQGLSVSLSQLCEVYLKTPGVEQIYIHGDSHWDSLMAVAVPTADFRAFWINEGITALMESRMVEQDMLSRLQETGILNHLKGYETIRSVMIECEPFTVENGLLNQSMKLNFGKLRKKYEDVLTSRLLKVGEKE
jgi:long-chain acyl-CoA synthetase